MASSRSVRPVIAIFGPNRPEPAELAAATLLAGAVNRAGAVLLTGGTGLRNTGQVKEEAIVAAEQTARDASHAEWIGVRNEEQSGPCEPVREHSLIVTPGWGHRRNFVEACICDAAFAVGGNDNSKGTASEILFCLYLRRPVIRIGVPQPDDAEAELAALLAAAMGRVLPGEADQLWVDRGVRGAYGHATEPDTFPDHRTFPADKAEAEQIVADLLELVGPATLAGLADEGGWDTFVGAELARSRRTG